MAREKGLSRDNGRLLPEASTHLYTHLYAVTAPLVVPFDMGEKEVEDLHVLIVGAGITGLLLAQGLKKVDQTSRKTHTYNSKTS